MRYAISSLAGLALLSAGVAQRPTYGFPNLEVTNFRGVISSVTCPVTGANFPAGSTVPPGYGGSGVAPGTRAWLYTPQGRTRQGQRGSHYFTIRGITEDIWVGACQTVFPGPNDYFFATGLTNVDPDPGPHGFKHTVGGPDIVKFPSMALAFTNNGGFRTSMSLTTPVVIQNTIPLCIFCEYQGGEQQMSSTRGQTIGGEWRGGRLNLTTGVYYGFTVGPQGHRTVTFSPSSLYRGQIGLIVDEPQFTATGYHGNGYHGNPFANEDYLGLSAHQADWSSSNTPNSTLFFHVSGGPKYANGQALVLANFKQASLPIRFPTPFGNLLLDFLDPIFPILTGTALNLDVNGDYTGGPASPIFMPQLAPGSKGWWFTFQAALATQSLGTIELTNASSIVTY